MTPSLKPAPIDDRAIVAIEETGICAGLGNTKVLLDSFFDRGIKHLLVTPGEPFATHWWMLRMKSGKRLAYFGTQESFSEFTRTGQGHIYQYGRHGKLS